MYGVSYVGATQWLSAKAKPPSLVAIAPGVTAADYHEGWAWQGGAFELGFNLSWAVGPLVAANWDNLSRRLGLSMEGLAGVVRAKDNLTEGYLHLPTQDMPHLKNGLADYYYDWLAHPDYDDYWKKVCIQESHSDITVPSLNMGGWYDVFLGGTIGNYVGMRQNGATEAARSGQRLLLGPWVHGSTPHRRVGGVPLWHSLLLRSHGPSGRYPSLLRPLAEG